MGGVIGGLSAGLQYGFSDAYQWRTHKTVMKWGIDRGRYDEAVKYAAAQWGADPSSFHYIEQLPTTINGEGGYVKKTFTNGDMTFKQGDVYIAKKCDD